MEGPNDDDVDDHDSNETGLSLAAAEPIEGFAALKAKWNQDASKYGSPIRTKRVVGAVKMAAENRNNTPATVTTAFTTDVETNETEDELLTSTKRDIAALKAKWNQDAIKYGSPLPGRKRVISGNGIGSVQRENGNNWGVREATANNSANVMAQHSQQQEDDADEEDAPTNSTRLNISALKAKWNQDANKSGSVLLGTRPEMSRSASLNKQEITNKDRNNSTDTRMGVPKDEKTIVTKALVEDDDTSCSLLLAKLHTEETDHKKAKPSSSDGIATFAEDVNKKDSIGTSSKSKNLVKESSSPRPTTNALTTTLKNDKKKSKALSAFKNLTALSAQATEISAASPPSQQRDNDKIKAKASSASDDPAAISAGTVAGESCSSPLPSQPKTAAGNSSNTPATERKKGYQRKSIRGTNAGRSKQAVLYRRQFQKIPNLPVYPHTDTEEDAILQALYNNELFSTLRVGQLGQLVSAFQVCQVAAGDIIVHQGDSVETDGYFYVIDSGIVEFTVEDQHIGTASSGGSFGELSLLYSTPRSATVLALEDCRLYRLDALTFRCILSAETQRCVHKKCRLVDGIHFFEGTAVVEAVIPRIFQAGETLVQQGKRSDAFYVVAEGVLHSKTTTATGTSSVSVLKTGDYFGERSLVRDGPALVNVVAQTDGLAFSLDRSTFERVLLGSNLAAASTAILSDPDIRRLSAIPFIQQFAGRTKISALAALLKDKSFGDGETILVERDNTKAALYLVKQGTVVISNSNEDRKKTISVGGCFGEGLMQRAHSKSKKSTKSPYTATAELNCVCSVLTLKDFWTLIPAPAAAAAASAPAVAAAAVIESKNQSPQQAPEKFRRQSLILHVPPATVRLGNLQKHSVLGEGTFGIVWLVSDATIKDSCRPYALKKQSKAFLVGENQVEAVIQEKIMLENMKHPFLINLFSTYQDEQFVYMLLDFVQGGELFSLMHEEDTTTFPEHQAKFYAFCLSDVLNFLHKSKYVYRDLKPENVMLDAQGYVKLIDFGFCKYLLADKTYTLCGTPGYLSPETVTIQGHSFSSDNWSLGILIYEMMTGRSPFYYDGIDQMELFESIVNDAFEPPATASAAASDILTRLLNKDPVGRLGSRDQNEILEHAWFAELDIEAMWHRKATAPWIPDVEGPLDTCYFNDWSELERDAEADHISAHGGSHGDISKKGQVLSSRDAKLFEGVF